MAFNADSFGRELSAGELAYYQPMFDQSAATEKYQQSMGVQTPSYSPYDFGGGGAQTGGFDPQPSGGTFGGASSAQGGTAGRPNVTGAGASGASGGVAGSGASGGYGGSSSSSTLQQNPYLRDQMAALTGQYQQSFLQNTAPQLRAGAMASGQYGGSRQGIAEGIAQGNAATGLSSALAQLQSGTYNTDVNSYLQNKSLDNQYSLGLGNLGLGYGNLGLGYQNSNNNFALGQGQLALTNQGQNQQFYTNQRNTDLQQMQLGGNLASGGIQGQQGIGQAQYTTGNVYQQAPMQAINSYNNAITPYTGYGQSSTTTGGGGLSGAIGGGLAGLNIGNRLSNLGMGGSSNLLSQRINPNSGEYIGSLEF